tara:strand:+ start:202 stop:462 length:261 start_codon:yes stop_codon:yes gene_type:complete
MKTIIKDKSRIRQVLEKLEQRQLEREFKSKNISDLIKKIKKHKNEEIRELEKENLDEHHPSYKDYKEGYIEGIKKCIDILNINNSL